MAISATTGSAASTTAAAASKALPSFNTTSGQDAYCAVALDSTSSSVTSILNSLGADAWSLVTAKNGTGVRIELWKCHFTSSQTGNVITINVSPNCNIAGAAEMYAGVSSLGNTDAESGSDTYPNEPVATQDGNNFVIAAIGFACQSGDTLSAQIGTSRQSSIPAATAVGVAIYDDTMIGKGIVVCETEISTARNWATVGLELRSGGAAIAYKENPAANMVALQAVADARFLRVTEPVPDQSAGGASNSGFVA